MVSEPDGRKWVVPPALWRWAGTRGGLLALAWVVALGVAGRQWWHARTAFDESDTAAAERQRADGNSGHAQIDFGGQWVMARMLVRGHGRELYNRNRQWEVVREAFPQAGEAPAVRDEAVGDPDLRTAHAAKDDVRHDADWMMWWFMGADSPRWKEVGGAAAAPLAAAPPFANPFAAAAYELAAADAVTPEVVAAADKKAVGGPLYPPVHAFFYAPMGVLDPQPAYFAFQAVLVGLAFVAGWGVTRLTGGRVWCPVAATLILLYPGCRSGLDLGQNPIISVAVLVWGWALAARGRDAAGGMLWGLFAFKPVWGMAFFLAPLLMGRWRFCLAMVGTGAALAAATLPVVGLQPWLDWLKVGGEASALYEVNHNWVHLSRHLDGIPRRFLIDFGIQPEEDRRRTVATVAGWGLWGAVFATTVAVYLWRGDRRRAVGVGAGFAFLGGFLTCYRFMYYDVMLSAAAVAILLADVPRWGRTLTFRLTPSAPPAPWPERTLQPPADPPPAPFGPRLLGYVNSFPLTVVVLLFLIDNVFQGMQVQATMGVHSWARPTTGADGATGFATPKLQADTGPNYPWDTGLLLALWAWCGLRLVLGEERKESSRYDGA